MALLTQDDKITKQLIVLQRKIHDEYEEISPLFHIYRVLILSHIAVQKRTFKQLKLITTLTDGNLASHLRPLDQLGMIKVIKGYDNRRPMTTYEITSKGRNCLEKMKNIFDNVSIYLNKGEGSSA